MAGKPRSTPKGTPLPGVWPDTRWGTSFEQFAGMELEDAIVQFLDVAEQKRSYWQELSSKGARSQFIVGLDGSRYLGTLLQTSELRRLCQLNIDLGLEIYADPNP